MRCRILRHLIWVYTVCSGLSVGVHTVNMVCPAMAFHMTPQKHTYNHIWAATSENIWTCTLGEDSDQPAHLHSLIKILIRLILDIQGCSFFLWTTKIKNIRILYIESAKIVNEMTLNELVKLTTLWTTGPRLSSCTDWFECSLEAEGTFSHVGTCVLFCVVGPQEPCCHHVWGWQAKWWITGQFSLRTGKSKMTPSDGKPSFFSIYPRCRPVCICTANQGLLMPIE